MISTDNVISKVHEYGKPYMNMFISEHDLFKNDVS